MSRPEKPSQEAVTLTETLKQRWLALPEEEKNTSKLVHIAAEIFVRSPGKHTNQDITASAKKFEKWTDDALIAAISSAKEAIHQGNLQDSQVLNIIVMGAILKTRSVEGY